MLLIRRFEEKAGQLYGMGLIGGFCHLYIGQEAVVVGMQMAMEGGDQVITGYRDHGHMLATGMESRSGVMAELTGRQGGYSKRQGRLDAHVLPREEFFGGHGIVGAQVPLGTGLGVCQQVSRQRQCLGHLFRRWRGQPGPGLRELQHGELWKLPVIYVIENNRYAMGTSTSGLRSWRNELSQRGPSAFLASRWTAWMSARSSRRPITRSEHCRSGKGPIILEMLTYRYRGHSMSDPAKYRTKDEVQKMRAEHDPIEQVKVRLLDQKWASEDDLKALDKNVREIVTDAADFAQNDPEPDVSSSTPTLYALRGGKTMPIDILMPALSPTMEEGKLAKWLKKKATG
jgi:pyruvate dehydrogenase E1 component alpha subunit